MCVMSRLTENDGRTPVFPWVQGKGFDLWVPLLAPPPRLVGGWYGNRLSWEDFVTGYRLHLGKEQIGKEVCELAERARRRDITLLCVEPLSEVTRCHRSILAEECQIYVPDLVVVHR